MLVAWPLARGLVISSYLAGLVVALLIISSK